MKVQEGGSRSLRPEPSRFNRSSYGILSPLGSQKGMESNVVWGWSQGHWLLERPMGGNVSEDLELKTLRKRLQSRIQKSVS